MNIEKAHREEKSPSKLGDSKGFTLSVLHLQLTLVMFSIFTYCAIWFICFNEGPAAWFENHYFMKNSGQRHAKTALANKTGQIDFIQENIQALLVALGLFCALVSFILYICLQLMKKLLRRMERVNTVVQIQCVVMATLALTLYVMVEMSINFDGVNSSMVIKNEMPWHFHNRFLAVAVFFLVISFFSFTASYYEVNVMFSVDSLLCIVGILCCIILGIITSLASQNIREVLDGPQPENEDNSSPVYGKGKCVFVLPQFSQEQLMDHGCSGKYLSYGDHMEDLSSSCQKVNIARVWEDNKDILVQDQKMSFGCLNLDCCAQVDQIVQGRFAMVQVACIFMVIYAILFMMNLQYMSKTISRYQIRFLNHKGDIYNVIPLAVLSISLLLLRRFYHFD